MLRMGSRLAALLSVLGAAAALADDAAALDKVTFGTNWVAEAEHGGYYQAVADGTYQECGLEVEVLSGGPQVNNRAKLVAGNIEFLMGGNMLQALFAIKEEIPIRVVAAHFQKEPQVLMSHPGQGLDTWESLKDATIFIADSSLPSFFRWMMVEHGFSLENRKPYTFNPAPFVADEKSVQQGYVTSEPFAVRQEGGFEPNVFLLADYGFNTYSTTVEVMQETIDVHPDWVQCFVDGSAIGWYNYLYGDATPANTWIKASNPEMSDAQIAFSTDQLRKYGIVDSGDALALGIGAMTHERQRSFYEKMVRAGVVEGGLDFAKAYTLDFVNKGVGLELKAKLLAR